MDLSQIDSLHAIAAKAKGIWDAPIVLLAASILKDEEGQIKWSSIITGALTAGMIASASSMITMQQSITELRTKGDHRAPHIDKIPAIETRQEYVLQELHALKTGTASATSERFRASDAARLEERIEKEIRTEITRLEKRIDDLERRGKR